MKLTIDVAPLDAETREVRGIAPSSPSAPRAGLVSDRVHARLCAILHGVFDQLGDAAAFGDVMEEAKRALARAGLPSVQPHHLTAAFDSVRIVRRNRGDAEVRSSLRGRVDREPLTRTEAAALYRQLGAGRALKRMPNARPLTVRDVRQAERARALRQVKELIGQQEALCDALEADAAEPKRRIAAARSCAP